MNLREAKADVVNMGLPLYVKGTRNTNPGDPDDISSADMTEFARDLRQMNGLKKIFLRVNCFFSMRK